MKRQLQRHLRHLSGLPIRADNVGPLLDTFILFAIFTIVFIRLMLWMTGYPQLGNKHLHIAHMLWGGLLMGAALILEQSLILRWVRRLGAVLGGIGFGLFIDELGKFITRDNDYFFKPTYALIYILFILFYFLTRHFLKKPRFTPQESLVNAIEYLKEASVRELDEKEKLNALTHLEGVDPKNPLRKPLQTWLEKITAVTIHRPFIWEKTGQWLHKNYLKWISSKNFANLIAIFFIVIAVYELFDLPYLVHHILTTSTVGLIDGARLVSSLLTAIFVITGDIQLFRGKRLSAYEWFEKALLVSLLIGQVFVFVKIQLKGILWFGLILFFFLGIRFLISQEKRLVTAPE